MDEMNHSNFLRFFWLDTSAITKIFFQNEKGSKNLLEIFEGKPDHFFYTADYCRYEFYNVLKRKLIAEKTVEVEGYLRCIFIFNSYLKLNRIHIDEIEHKETDIWLKTKQVVEKYALDYTDAIQFIFLKEGILRHFGGRSQPILIASDLEMIKAAESENIKCWNPEKGPLPVQEL